MYIYPSEILALILPLSLQKASINPRIPPKKTVASIIAKVTDKNGKSCGINSGILIGLKGRMSLLPLKGF